jgi:hypothetical protein
MDSLISDFTSKTNLNSEIITIYRKKRNDARAMRRRGGED